VTAWLNPSPGEWLNAQTGNRISAHRAQTTTETVGLEAEVMSGEMCLLDLRALVDRCAHIPGHALVKTRANCIEVEFVDTVVYGAEAVTDDE
jgi:hypothetical protein